MSTWTTDLKFAFRMAVKTPWMTGASVVALGAAMAVTIFGFSLLWESYFAELPFEHSERIVQSQTTPGTEVLFFGMFLSLDLSVVGAFRGTP